MEKTLISIISGNVPTTIKSEPKNKIARPLVTLLCLLGLATAIFTYPMALLIGLAVLCVLLAIVYHATFLIAMLRPSPKKFDGVEKQ